MQCRRCCFCYVIAWTAVLPAAIIVFELAEPDISRQSGIACQQQDPAQQQEGCPGPWPGVWFSGTARKADSHPWQPRIGPAHAPAVLTPAWLPAGKAPAQHSTCHSTTGLVSCCSCSAHHPAAACVVVAPPPPARLLLAAVSCCSCLVLCPAAAGRAAGLLLAQCTLVSMKSSTSGGAAPFMYEGLHAGTHVEGVVPSCSTSCRPPGAAAVCT